MQGWVLAWSEAAGADGVKKGSAGQATTGNGGVASWQRTRRPWQKKACAVWMLVGMGGRAAMAASLAEAWEVRSELLLPSRVLDELMSPCQRTHLLQEGDQRVRRRAGSVAEEEPGRRRAGHEQSGEQEEEAVAGHSGWKGLD